jgi:hypothetical protein
MKDQNEIFFHFSGPNLKHIGKKLDNMIFSSYWRKTTYKKHFTNLTSLENYLLFLYPLMYSWTEEETIQTRKYHVTYLFEMICKSVNCNDQLSRTFTKPTRTSARGSFQRKHSEVNQMSLPFWGLRP